MLLILEVNERTTTSIMGWSSTGMAKRYQHVIDEIRTKVADKVGGLLWEAQDTPTGWEALESQFRRMLSTLEIGGDQARVAVAEMITILEEIHDAVADTVDGNEDAMARSAVPA